MTMFLVSALITEKYKFATAMDNEYNNEYNLTAIHQEVANTPRYLLYMTHMLQLN